MTTTQCFRQPRSIHGFLFTLALAACTEPGLPADDEAAPASAAVPDDGAALPHIPGTAIVRMPGGVRRVYYKNVGGRALMEGDIDLGAVEQIERPVFGGAVHSDLGTRWPNGEVPFNFDSTVSAATRTAVRAQLTFLARVSPLVFVEVPALSYLARIEYHQNSNSNVDGGSSPVGRTGAPQVIRFAGNPSTDTILHETLHSLGLWHEQSRPDRNDFVSIRHDCIDLSERHNFDRHDDFALGLGLYDFNSIMHYTTGSFCAIPMPSTCAVDLDGDGRIDVQCATMTRVSNGDNIFPPSSLSREDLNTLWRMYADKLANGEVGDHFGNSLAVGDFDGDGYGDVAIGVPDEDVGSETGAGRVHLMRGTSKRLVPWRTIDQDDLPGLAVEPGDQFGAALAAGDTNGDGIDDLVIGAPGENSGAGVAVLLRGSDAGPVFHRAFTQSSIGLGTAEAGDRFGAAVAIAPDLARDHAGVVVIGSPGERNGTIRSGAAFLSTVSDLTGQAVQQKLFDAGGSDGGQFGAALATGAIDNNRDDLAVGAPGSLGRGTVHVYTGQTPTAGNPALVVLRQRLLPPSSAMDDFGAALAIGNVRDVGATTRELVVGAPGTNAGAGAAIIYERSLTGVFMLDRQTLTQPTPESGDRFGAAIAIANLDPVSDQDDLAIGAPGEDSGEGAVSIFRGNLANATHLQHLTNASLPLQLNETEDSFGAVVAALNVNGVGDDLSSDEWNDADRHIADLIVGVPGEGIDPVSIPGVPQPEGPLRDGAIGVFLGDGGALSASRFYHQASVGNE